MAVSLRTASSSPSIRCIGIDLQPLTQEVSEADNFRLESPGIIKYKNVHLRGGYDDFMLDTIFHGSLEKSANIAAIHAHSLPPKDTHIDHDSDSYILCIHHPWSASTPDMTWLWLTLRVMIQRAVRASTHSSTSGQPMPAKWTAMLYTITAVRTIAADQPIPDVRTALQAVDAAIHQAQRDHGFICVINLAWTHASGHPMEWTALWASPPPQAHATAKTASPIRGANAHLSRFTNVHRMLLALAAGAHVAWRDSDVTQLLRPWISAATARVNCLLTLSRRPALHAWERHTLDQFVQLRELQLRARQPPTSRASSPLSRSLAAALHAELDEQGTASLETSPTGTPHARPVRPELSGVLSVDGERAGATTRQGDVVLSTAHSAAQSVFDVSGSHSMAHSVRSVGTPRSCALASALDAALSPMSTPPASPASPAPPVPAMPPLPAPLPALSSYVQPTPAQPVPLPAVAPLSQPTPGYSASARHHFTFSPTGQLHPAPGLGLAHAGSAASTSGSYAAPPAAASASLPATSSPAQAGPSQAESDLLAVLASLDTSPGFVARGPAAQPSRPAQAQPPAAFAVPGVAAPSSSLTFQVRLPIPGMAWAPASTSASGMAVGARVLQPGQSELQVDDAIVVLDGQPLARMPQSAVQTLLHPSAPGPAVITVLRTPHDGLQAAHGASYAGSFGHPSPRLVDSIAPGDDQLVPWSTAIESPVRWQVRAPQAAEQPAEQRRHQPTQQAPPAALSKLKQRWHNNATLAGQISDVWTVQCAQPEVSNPQGAGAAKSEQPAALTWKERMAQEKAAAATCSPAETSTRQSLLDSSPSAGHGSAADGPASTRCQRMRVGAIYEQIARTPRSAPQVISKPANESPAPRMLAFTSPARHPSDAAELPWSQPQALSQPEFTYASSAAFSPAAAAAPAVSAAHCEPAGAAGPIPAPASVPAPQHTPPAPTRPAGIVTPESAAALRAARQSIAAAFSGLPAPVPVPAQAPVHSSPPAASMSWPPSAHGRTPVVVFGVSGAGKSSIAQRLAQTLDQPFIDADDLHDSFCKQKMAAGQPLNDADRMPWLQRVGAALAAHPSPVVACSALKRAYRAVLVAAAPATTMLWLSISTQQAMARVSSRAGHFMPSSLVHSQFEALEVPSADESYVRELPNDGTQPIARVVAQAVELLQRPTPAPAPAPAPGPAPAPKLPVSTSTASSSPPIAEPPAAAAATSADAMAEATPVSPHSPASSVGHHSMASTGLQTVAARITKKPLGLKLGNTHMSMAGEAMGARVLDIAPNSQALGQLEPGDVLLSMRTADQAESVALGGMPYAAIMAALKAAASRLSRSEERPSAALLLAASRE